MGLLDELKFSLGGALIRKASTTTSKWSENYVILGKPKPGPHTFYWHPWQREMMDCTTNWSGRKAAQMGYSHVALCKAISANDIQKIDVLYLLPKRSPDAADFSKAKFDGLLELSPHLQQLYSNTRNIGHKQAGSVNLYIRGARSRSGLKSISVGLQIWDELDEMPKRQLALALERSSGYDEEDTQLIKISTPTVPDFGIDAEIKFTDQSIFVFKCPNCSQLTDLPFPHCLKITADSLDDQVGLKKSYIFCPLCKGKLNHEDKPRFLAGGKWVPQKSGFETRGFLINQYYSTVIPPWRIAETYIKGHTMGEESELQEYWNSKGGIAYLPEGARVSDADIAACIRGHSRKDVPNYASRLITMGVDVGKVLHVWLDIWELPEVLGADLNMFARCRNVYHGILDTYDELESMMSDFQVKHAVIDWQPDERKTYEFCQKFAGFAHRCYFHRGLGKKRMMISEDELLVGVGRTPWLDLSLGRFQLPRRTIELPHDMLPEAKIQMKNLAKLQKKDDDGNVISRYVSTGTDHYAFARLYSEIALPFAAAGGRSENVTAFL